MLVTIKMRLEEALALQTGQPATTALQQFLTIINELGGELRPIHPGAKHPFLAPYFTVKMSDPALATQLIRRLLNCPIIEAAYVEPPAERPSG
jgi:hypothetical protein